MGKSKGRVPIKGGSKKVRQIKNVQEGGRSIGSDKDMDIKMTKLLHFFKDVVENNLNGEQLEVNANLLGAEAGLVGDAVKAAKKTAFDTFIENLSKLFSFLGGNTDIILLRQRGRLAGITTEGPKGKGEANDAEDTKKSTGYIEAMTRLGFVMDEHIAEKQSAALAKKGELRIAEISKSTPPSDAAHTDRLVFKGFSSIGEPPVALEETALDLGQMSTFEIQGNNIKITKGLHQLLGIPGKLKDLSDPVKVNIDIFNEYRLPILHHILNLQIHLIKNLNNFFTESPSTTAVNLISVKSGRFLNATGYHIKEKEKLTRFDLNRDYNDYQDYKTKLNYTYPELLVKNALQDAKSDRRVIRPDAAAAEALVGNDVLRVLLKTGSDKALPLSEDIKRMLKLFKITGISKDDADVNDKAQSEAANLKSRLDDNEM